MADSERPAILSHPWSGREPGEMLPQRNSFPFFSWQRLRNITAMQEKGLR